MVKCFWRRTDGNNFYKNFRIKTKYRPALGPNGELLGPDGKPILGPNGCFLGPDGKPLCGPNGEMLLAPDGRPAVGPGQYDV